MGFVDFWRGNLRRRAVRMDSLQFFTQPTMGSGSCFFGFNSGNVRRTVQNWPAVGPLAHRIKTAEVAFNVTEAGSISSAGLVVVNGWLALFCLPKYIL